MFFGFQFDNIPVWIFAVDACRVLFDSSATAQYLSVIFQFAVLFLGRTLLHRGHARVDLR